MIKKKYPNWREWHVTRRYHAEQLSWLKFEIKYRCEVCEVHYLSIKFILQLALFECQFNRTEKKRNSLNKIVYMYIILYYDSDTHFNDGVVSI